MANPDGVFLYLGTYPDEASARADYDVVNLDHSSDPRLMAEASASWRS